MYLVYELNGGIECLYSNDDGQNLNVIVITNNGHLPAISAAGETVVCSYTRDGNLYASISEDGGASWEEIPQVNDVSGSVIEQQNCQHVSGKYVAWTDNRNGFNGIYFDTVGIAVPNIEITSITGGMGVSAVISNTGKADATDVHWSINLEGGLIIVGGSAEGTISAIPAGGSTTVKIPFVLGLGGVTILAAADGATKISSGTVLLFFVTGVS